MPELPEVETHARDLRPQLVGQQIVEAHVLWPRTVAAPDLPLFLALVSGQRITTVGRRGKFLIFNMESGDAMLIHLRMSGGLHVEQTYGDEPTGPHVRAWFELSDGRRLVFTDMRKFGRIWLVPDPGPLLAGLGPEPMEASFTAEALAERIRGRRTAIKPLLLDQTVVAGVGNIYADESLFLAGIHPRRPASSLTDDEICRLWRAIRGVLNEAVEQRGTTVRDYHPPLGGYGNYMALRRVYQRTGQPCPNCGTPISRIVIAQRSAHFCPHCQPLEEEL